MPRPDEEEITVRLTGGGPWGFRLRGGAGTDVPLTVAKVRKKSKAYPVLEEGDRILRVNGHSCSHLSYDHAMNLVDQGGPNLVLDLLRTKKVPKFSSGPKTWEQVVSSEYHTKSAAETEGLQIKSFQVQTQDKALAPSQEKMETQASTIQEQIPSQDAIDSSLTQITTIADTHSTSLPTTVADSETSKLESMSSQVTSTSQRQEIRKSERTQEVRETTQETSSSEVNANIPDVKVSSEIPDGRPSTPSVLDARKTPRSLNTSPRPFTPTFSSILPKASDDAEVSQPGGKPLTQILGPRPFTPTHITDSFTSSGVESKTLEKTFQSRGPRPFTPSSADAKTSQTTKFTREEKSVTQCLGPRPFTPISSDQGKESSFIQQSTSSFSSTITGTSDTASTRKEEAFAETKTKIDDMIREIEADFFDKKENDLNYSSKQEVKSVSIQEKSPEKPQQDQTDNVPAVTNPKIYMPPPESEMQDLHFMTRKKKIFSSSSFYEEPNAIYPTVEEQVELCRKIADSLSSASNQRSKGASMFFKRVKRSQRWVHEAPGGGGSRYSESTTEESEAEDMPYVKVSKGPPKLKLILDPRQIQDLSTLKKQGIAFVEHTAQSPEICRDIVRDLNSPQGRGAAMFAKRKLKSEEWVVNEERVREHLRKAAASRSSTPATPQPRGSAPAFQGSHTLPRTQKFKMVKSPWEAALESPYGSCDSAFVKVHPNEVAETVIKAAETKLTASCLSPQRGWSATTTDVSSVGSSMTPEPIRPDRPSFNTVPRAWGSPPADAKPTFRPVQFAAAAAT